MTETKTPTASGKVNSPPPTPASQDSSQRRRRGNSSSPQAGSGAGFRRLEAFIKTSVEVDLSQLNLNESPSTPKTNRIRTSTTVTVAYRPRRIISDVPIDVSDSSPGSPEYRDERREPVTPTMPPRTPRSAQSLSYTDITTPPSNVSDRRDNTRQADKRDTQTRCMNHEALPASSLPSSGARRSHNSLHPPSVSGHSQRDEFDLFSPQVIHLASSTPRARRFATTPPRSVPCTPRSSANRHAADDVTTPTSRPQSSTRVDSSTASTYTARGDGDDSDNERDGSTRARWVRDYGYESESDDDRYAKKAWYMVARGKGHTGVYKTWDRVFDITHGVSGAHQKGYHSKADALEAYRNAVLNRRVKKLGGTAGRSGRM